MSASPDGGVVVSIDAANCRIKTYYQGLKIGNYVHVFCYVLIVGYQYCTFPLLIICL